MIVLAFVMNAASQFYCYPTYHSLCTLLYYLLSYTIVSQDQLVCHMMCNCMGSNLYQSRDDVLSFLKRTLF